MGKEGEKYYPAIFERWINTIEIDNAEHIADKMGEEGKKLYPRVLIAYRNRKLPSYAESVAEKMGKEGEKFLPEILNDYLRDGSWRKAEYIALKIGEEGKKAIPKILEGYMKEDEDNPDLDKYHIHLNGWLHDAELLLTRKMGKEGEKIGEKMLPQILDAYIRRNQWTYAESLAEKIGIKDERLAEIYEHTGKSMKAKNLRRILEEQNNKLGLENKVD